MTEGQQSSTEPIWQVPSQSSQVRNSGNRPHFITSLKFDGGLWWRTRFVCLFACFSSGTGHHRWFDHLNSLDDGLQNVLIRTNVKTTIIPLTPLSKLDKNYIHEQFLAAWTNQSNDTVNSMAMAIMEIDLHVPSFGSSIKCNVTNIHWYTSWQKNSSP